MAGKNVLAEFLIAIGADTSKFDIGIRNVERGMQGVKSTALSLSGVMASAAIGVGIAVAKTAANVDSLNTSLANSRTGSTYVYNLGNAFKLLGGNAEDALKLIQNVESGLNALKKGDASFIEKLALAGVDVSGVDVTTTPQELLDRISDQTPAMDQQKRSNVAEALGTTPVATRVLDGGSAQFEARLLAAQAITGDRDGLGEGSRHFGESLTKLGLGLEGTANELTYKFLPALNKAADQANDLFSEYVRPGINKAADFSLEHPGESALTVGGALTGTIASTTSAILARLGFAGLAAGAGTVAASGGSAFVLGGALLANQYGREHSDTYRAVSDDAWDRTMNEVGGLDSFVSKRLGLGTAPNTGDMSNQWLPIDRSGQQYGPEAMPTPSDGSMRRELDDMRTQLDNRAASPQAPIKVENKLTVQLDGQALEAKIIETNERQNYSAIDDLRSSTHR